MLTGPHIKKLNFDRCDHKVLGTCSTQAEGCCGVVACNLCIEITSDYTDEIVERKVAPFSSPGYAATLGNVVFEAYWRRDYTTDECVFIVEITDAVETQVLEFSKCYDAASCMAPAGSLAILYNDKPHVLSWEPLDVVTLKHRVEGKCKKPFCGECTCAPREICVKLNVGDCIVSELVGLDPSECKEEDPPVWEFTLVCPDGGPTISGTVSLLREEYTNACILNVVIPAHYIDVDYEWLECPDIDDLEVSFTIPGPDGYLDATVLIRAADCDLCEGITVSCCGGIDLPDEIPLIVEDGYGLCGSTQLALTNNGNPNAYPDAGPTPGGFWVSPAVDLSFAAVDAGGEICEPLTIQFRIYCDPGGPVFRLDYKCTRGDGSSPWNSVGADYVCLGDNFAHAYSTTNIVCPANRPGAGLYIAGINFLWWIP